MTQAGAVRIGAAALLALLFVLLFWRLGMFIHTGDAALHWPYQLDYGEGIVWQQAKLMFSHEAYGPINGFPAIVFHYPPLYHVVVRGVTALGGSDMFYAGRAVSMIATALAAVMIGLISARTLPQETPKFGRVLAGSVAGLIIFSFYPVMLWGLLFRVDMLALLLSLTGFWLGLKALERPVLIYWAALFFVLGVFTKQSSIAAPTALFAMLLLSRSQLALKGIATCIVLGGLVFGGLEVVTHSGFARHIILYNMNPMNWTNVGRVTEFFSIYRLFCCVALLVLVMRISEMRGRLSGKGWRGLAESPSDAALTALVFYLIIATLMLSSFAKAGAYVNYYLEWLYMLAMLLGMALAETVNLAIRPASAQSPSLITALTAFIIPIAMVAQVWWAPSPKLEMGWSAQRMAEMAALSARIRAADKPVICDEMVLLQRSGKRVVIEPMIFNLITHVGTWDERQYVRRIRNKDFAMFVTMGLHDPLFYSPAVQAAMDEAYPHIEKQAGYYVHLPVTTDNGKRAL